MRRTLDELFAVVYRFYPRGTTVFDPGYSTTEENRRLVAARKHAGGEAQYDTWRALLRRLGERFPGREVVDRSQHLAGGTLDACYAAKIELPREGAERERDLGLLVSFLAPVYVVYRSCFFASDRTLPIEERAPRLEIAFDLSDEEAAVARTVAEEIERCFPGHESMPPEIGSVTVPDVDMGWSNVTARLYDLLFMNEW